MDCKIDKDGVVFPVRVSTRGKRNALEVQNDKIAIIVNAAPHDGEANAAVIAVAASALGAAKSCVEIARGHKSRDKMLRVRGQTEDEIRARLQFLETSL